MQRQINEFIEMSKRTMESFLSKERKNIVVVAYYPTYRKHYGELLVRLKEKYNVIIVVERVLGDAFESSGHHNLYFPWRVMEDGQTYYLNMDVDGIDLILTADEVGYEDGRIDRTFLSTKAKRVYFPHSLIEQTGASDVVDYILVPSKIAMESFKNALKNSRVKLLESGYPKLDAAINSYAYQDSNTITYAPSLRYFSGDNASLNLFSGFENAMVESLLELTDYKISYRAHPMNFQNHHTFYNLIKARWQNESRVSFDEQLGNAFCNFSDFLVTDFSTTAFTYSFTTLRPSLFFTPLKLESHLAKYISSGGGQNL
ncbi:CDP-glycerol glycerophosphotransferase family protein [Helicobacter sp.]|uniref:CDP-glycerol glycerophosphotransferase family protein n=1 Tax=Helicobacter sp. TaxID=218 RepID=UPI0025B8AC5E|nr:CDP-glycerol glycerophosphotransferase family protein [Helicobacter sp.]MCI5967962.1 CDP-glycerol glycerophosphotransferase family protein [Helicobacter sp.]